MSKLPTDGSSGSKLLLGVRQVWWLLPAIIALGWVSTFRIETIICRVDQQPCPPAALDIAKGHKGQWLLWPKNVENLRSELGAGGFSVVGLTRELPSTLRLHAEIKSIAYGISQTGASEGWVVNQQGRVFPMVWNGALTAPIVVTQQDLGSVIASDAVKPSLHTFLWELVSALEQSQIPLKGLELMNDNLVIVHLESGGRGVIDSDQPKLQVQRLELLLQARDLEQLPSGVMEFDVRYKLPVVRTTSN